MRSDRALFSLMLLGALAPACSEEGTDADEGAGNDASVETGDGNQSDAAPSEPHGDQDAAADQSQGPSRADAEVPPPAAEPDGGGASDPEADDATDGGAEDDSDEQPAPDLEPDSGGSDAPSLHDASTPSAADAEAPNPDEDGGVLPEVPAGSVPAWLAGVWQQTRASAADYEFDDGFGGSFSLTSGFSVQLKITPEGAYYFAHYSSGASSNCASVSQFDQSVGSAVLDGDTLTLYPHQRAIEATSCSDSRVYDGGTEPIVFTLGLGEDRQYYGGMRTYELSVEGWSHPLELTSLFRVPDYEAFQPEQPADFVLGTDSAYEELQGLWGADSGSDVDFYNPQTGAYYLPELNGSPHRWIRFEQDAYEVAVALQTVNSEGVCKSDLIYYERGTAVFQVNEDVGGQGTHFVGDTRFDSVDSRLIVNIRECDEDDGVFVLELEPLSSYYAFNIYTESPQMFELNCKFERSEWQSLLCEQGFAGYYKR